MKTKGRRQSSNVSTADKRYFPSAVKATPRVTLPSGERDKAGMDKRFRESRVRDVTRIIDAYDKRKQKTAKGKNVRLKKNRNSK